MGGSAYHGSQTGDKSVAPRFPRRRRRSPVLPHKTVGRPCRTGLPSAWIEDPRQHQPTRERWRRLYDRHLGIVNDGFVDTVDGEILEVREQADEGGELFDASSGISQREGPNGGFQDIEVLVQPKRRLTHVKVPNLKFLKVGERVQMRHRRRQQEVRLVDVSSGNHPADKMDHPHPLEIVDSPEPCRI